MGYYTYYELEELTGVDFGEGKSPESVVVELLGDDPFEDRCKWYDHDIDMKKLSLKFPSAVFSLKGNGEEAPDLWVKYYHNGKVQASRAAIMLAGFDASKLTDDASVPGLRGIF